MTANRAAGRAARALPALLFGLALGASPTRAQQVVTSNGAAREPVAPATRRTTVPPEDFGRWESLGGSELSPDGRWLAVQIQRVNEENELRVARVADPEPPIVVPHGSRASFSDDSRWLAFSVGVSEDERERLEERHEPVHDALGLVELDTRQRTTIEDVASFAFSGDGHWLAVSRYPVNDEDREAEGVDLLVRELSTGTDINFGNVSEYAWRDDGALLAMIVDAEGRRGNGVRVFDPATGRITSLDTRPTRYSSLIWREDAADLAVLRAVRASRGDGSSIEDGDGASDRQAAVDADGGAWADTAWVALAFRGVDRAFDGEASAFALDPARTPSFPAERRIVPWEELRWSDDGEILFLGLKDRVPSEPCSAADPARSDDGADDDGPGRGGGPRADAPTASGEGDAGRTPGDGPASCDGDEDDEDVTSVEIWHADDVDIVPTQKVRIEQGRRENDLAAWHLSEARLVPLEDELTEDVDVVDGAPYAVGRDGTPYDVERMFGPVYEDVYAVDVATGEKKKLLEQVEFFVGPSPDGAYLLFFEDDNYRTLDVANGTVTCITCELPATFVDLEDDHTVQQKPPFGDGGWLEDGSAVLLYDEHDVWRVAADGSGGERLTEGAAANLRYRRVRLDPDEEAIDPGSAQYFSLYDDWAETWGYGRSDRLGGNVETLVQGPVRYAALQKAEHANVYAYEIESFEDSPDVFVGGPALSSARQVTRTNPFQSDYLWGHAELVTYTNEWGDTLQGSLYYPADYEPGRQYPMITYIYEIRSNAVRSYAVPSQRDYYNFQAWVQDGYFVFQPDIVYHDRDPGVSAVVNIEPAVRAVLATGMVDPEHIGLIGHSWGGYQTTFFVTQSDLFTAAVAGAPLTDLFSMYLSVYWNSGGTDARIFEISQARMEVPFWEDEAAYRRNSPVFHIENMHTPLLMAQGTLDGAVDYNQGVEFYNAARRAGKDFVFLVYNDENHGFRKEANQLDYHRRIGEWFGHYLKGEPAPAWMTKGVPYLEQPGGRSGG